MEKEYDYEDDLPKHRAFNTCFNSIEEAALLCDRTDSGIKKTIAHSRRELKILDSFIDNNN